MDIITQRLSNLDLELGKELIHKTNNFENSDNYFDKYR